MAIFAHPTKEPLIIIRPWQLEFCGNNQCAAALLSFFEYWHEIKLNSLAKNQQANDIAERHGDPRSQNEDLLQFHTLEQIEKGILIFKRDAIRHAIYLLEKIGAIVVTKNPNPRYNFDKTKYFSLNTELIEKFLDQRKTNPRSTENQSSKAEKPQRRSEKPQPQTENRPFMRASDPDLRSKITTEITEKITEEEHKIHAIDGMVGMVESQAIEYLNPELEIDNPINKTISLQVAEQSTAMPTPSTNTANKPNTIPSIEAQIIEIYQFYMMMFPNKKIRLIKDKIYWNKIRDRLKEGYSVEDLKQAIRGCTKSDHHMGRLPDQPKLWDSLELIMRDQKHVDMFIDHELNNQNKFAPTELRKETSNNGKYPRKLSSAEAEAEALRLLREKHARERAERAERNSNHADHQQD